MYNKAIFHFHDIWEEEHIEFTSPNMTYLVKVLRSLKFAWKYSGKSLKSR